jgi:hypothetical protein
MRVMPTWGELLLIVGSSTGAMGCGSATDLPETGEIGVRVSTSGPEPDPNGYRVRADAGTTRGVGVEDSTLFEGLSPGSHTITLTDLAANCSTGGDGQRTATVEAGATATVAFQVVCAATAALRVVTRSEGVADRDGYQLEIRGRDSRPIGRNESITVGRLQPGMLELELGGLAPGCTVTGNARRAVTLVAGDTAEVTFEVQCAPPLGGSSISVSVHTSAILAPMPTGYTITLDGGRATSIGANGSVALTQVSPGTHAVKLSGLPSYCAVGGFTPAPNPVQVTVSLGAPATVTFGVLCLG